MAQVVLSEKFVPALNLLEGCVCEECDEKQ